MPPAPAPDPAELYQALAEIAPDPIIAIDAASTILSVNSATERTFGYPASQLVGESLLTIIPARFQARHLAGMQRYIETGERRISWQRVQVPVVAQSGEEIPVEITFTEFVADARGALTPEQHKDVERIRRSGQHLLGLINDVLNFAKLEAGEVEFDLHETSIGAVLDGLEELILPQAEAERIRYSQDIRAGDVIVCVDADKVRQVILNLLANAVKFTEPGGAITLSCDADAQQVHIAVHDTGRGIPPGQLQRVFDPFVQIDRHLTTASQQGVGLGLAISRDLARSMGGELTVTSSVGAGSTFTLHLRRA